MTTDKTTPPPLSSPRFRPLLAASTVLTALTTLAFLAVGCAKSNVALQDVPRPDTASFEAPVQQQLAAAFEKVQQAPSSAAAANAQGAEAYGELGRTLHAYELRDAAEVAYRNAQALAQEKFEWSYLLGVVLQEQGKLELAANALERAVELEGEDLPARVRLAHTLLDTNRLAEARSQLETALEQDSECALAHYFIGQVELAEEDPAQAVIALGRALELQPQANRLHHALGRAYRGLQDLERAAAAINQAGSREVALEDPIYLALDDLEISAAAFVRRAGRAQVAGALETAIELYRQAVKTAPENAEARAGLGASLARLGRLEEAREHLAAALRHGDESAWVRYNIAGVHRLAGEAAPAIENYRAAVTIEPDYLEAWIGLAQMLAAIDRVDEAVKTLEGRLETGSELPRLHLELASIHLANGNLQAVKQQHVAALEADPSPAQKAWVHRQRAEVARATGDADAALKEYELAIEIDGNDLESQFARANLLGAAGRFEEATLSYRRVVDRAPAHQAARIGEATALSLLGRYGEAITRLEEGLRRTPEDPELSHTLARLLLQNPDPALRDPAKALALVTKASRGGGSLGMAQTQAMALAELGRFEEAIDLQGQLIAELQRLGQTAAIPAATAQLQSYRQRQAASR